jgi:CRP-like cAMP-binding protein
MVRQINSEFDGWSALAHLGKICRYEARDVLYTSHIPALCLFRVVEGYVKISRYFPDGRCQILSFCGPGDYFGFEEKGSQRNGEAEALGQSRIIAVDHAALDRATNADGRITAWRCSILSAEVRRSQNLILALGRMNADEKVDYFLTHVVRGGAGREIHLPMNFTDIGDFLGLRIETISRTMSKMMRLGMLQRVKGTTRFLHYRTRVEAHQLAA